MPTAKHRQSSRILPIVKYQNRYSLENEKPTQSRSTEETLHGDVCEIIEQMECPEAASGA
jgi:hypothetical protein